MKTIQLSPTEFVSFKALANQLEILFMYWVSQGTVYVEADSASLHELGY